MTFDEHTSPTRHWNDRYLGTSPTEVSWFEERPTTSLELIDLVAPGAGRSVVDVGGGASHLVDHLVERGDEVTVVDISEVALRHAQGRLAGVETVDWVVTDVRTWEPRRRFDVWHDRALLHFLTSKDDRAAYLDVLQRAVGPGGGFVLATFAEDGPTHCSGLPVRRYTAADLRAVVGNAEVVAERHVVHQTPNGSSQAFQWLAGRFTDTSASRP